MTTNLRALPVRDVPWLLTEVDDGRVKVAFARHAGVYYASAPDVVAALRDAAQAKRTVLARYDLATKLIHEVL